MQNKDKYVLNVGFLTANYWVLNMNAQTYCTILYKSGITTNKCFYIKELEIYKL